MAVYQAKQQGIKNFSVLVSIVLVPPAMEAILGSDTNRVQGFLAAGHVCAIMGYEEYIPIAAKYKVPIVVTGFEPLDILQGIAMCVAQLEEGRYEVENQYTRAVTEAGNLPAQHYIKEVFRVVNRKWRGIGEIGSSGVGLRPEYAEFDAESALQRGRLHRRGEPAVHQRPDHAGAEEAARVQRLRQAVHAGEAAGRAHGFQ